MNDIIVYSTKICPYCVAAKRLLQQKGLMYQEIMIDKDLDQRMVMIDKSGRTSVPQIFINDKHIGGYDELSALIRSGQLDSLLET